MRFRSKLCAIIPAFLSAACSVSPPKNIKVVNDFDSQRYLGTWYEIARFDHRFERGLKVVNRGFNTQKQQWQESTGKAYFTGSPQVAALKVSFFGPFYGGYNVIELDADYRYALVCGPNRGYLWILSRTPTLDAATRDRLVQTAKNNGFDTDKLIWVKQTQHQ
ncbi:lipocalin family protein [Serratia liquefaciens]|uniref:lipocalin family protein n=1 Tax=Serratia liquefaciens TaxID=614 RepID=UPI0039AF1252